MGYKQRGVYIAMQSKITQWDRYVKTKGNKRIEMCEKKNV